MSDDSNDADDGSPRSADHSSTPEGRSRSADDQTRPPDDRPRRANGRKTDPLSKAGSLAYQSLLAVLVLGLLIVVNVALGFLVYRGALEAGPFLLLVGILVGFSLGRLDAVL